MPQTRTNPAKLRPAVSIRYDHRVDFGLAQFSRSWRMRVDKFPRASPGRSVARPGVSKVLPHKRLGSVRTRCLGVVLAVELNVIDGQIARVEPHRLGSLAKDQRDFGLAIIRHRAADLALIERSGSPVFVEDMIVD